MMGMGDNPVTLVVKAPNQRIEDQTIDCFLDWTVRKLKEHLEAVYPSNPKHNQQKLIYSGKLLPDDVTLKEVLRQIDEAALHTVHLVCSHSDLAAAESSDMSSAGSVPSTPSGSNYSTVSSSSSDGLRYRGSNPVTYGNTQANVFNPGAVPAAMSNPAVHNPMMAGFTPAGSPMMMQPQAGYYTPEQYMWMQQMYSQYMAQYMQYYQTMNPSRPDIPVAPATPAANDIPANQNRPANGAAANQNVRMNAQGGMVDDDDEEDIEHRDWLDYIFVSFRFLVLVSIVYFYSSLSRFVYVLGGFFFIYLLQNGWAMLRQNARAPPAEEQPAQAEPAEAPPANEPDGAETEDTTPPQEGENSGEVTAEPAYTETATTSPPAPEPEKLGAFAVFWSFVSTFFTSLVPQQPPGVNGN
ncbi:homocysteine-responsive endoplasmic reticulum-resident ubiquitin-like domain member 2 protein [Gigantopelta aegis]|uniref:homocysteine-responsive endoplasmic reticulum-resident ubiquitin-like domain member 2 protein n=1 Tax=Gigantopelta aegis TaxID=1735272 RepID=UPI001B88E324|nr:homocysteine-responsive endoplasmic reticulum-resident ubiquitin-like domain member 2 protein [Gigantopelta aegis]